MTRRIELSPRLRLAADLVPEGARLADVGTDHAYLPACLLMEGKIPSAIAADLREGPLRRARETAAEYGCGDRMAFRLCDGLSGIRPEETDAVLNGTTPADAFDAFPRVHIAPDLVELRQWLGEDGFHILEERLAREGDTLYVVMRAEAGEEPAMTPAQLWVGRQSRDPLRGDYLRGLLEKLDRALDVTAGSLDGSAEAEELPGLALALALRSYADRLACQRILELLRERRPQPEKNRK